MRDTLPPAADKADALARPGPALARIRWWLIGVALLAIVVSISYVERGNERARPRAEEPPDSPKPASADAAMQTNFMPAPVPATEPSEGAASTTTTETLSPPTLPQVASKGRAFINSLGVEFVPVPGTKVLFARWETRVKDYRGFAKATQQEIEKPRFDQKDDHPAVNVSWEDARAFCAWLSTLEHRDYRLPTDQEWSAAIGLVAEAGEKPKERQASSEGYLWGAQWPPPADVGNFADDSPLRAHASFGFIARYHDGFFTTAPVGSFTANSLGLYDLGGNAWEWCEDQYDPSDSKPNAFRVWRGASWRGAIQSALRASYRGYDRPDSRSDSGGFRVVLALSGD
jgi:hypothetical protein